MLLGAAIGLASPTMAATPACRNPASFDRWLAAVQAGSGSARYLATRHRAALRGVTFDPAMWCGATAARACSTQSFLQFAGRMAGGGRYQNGLKQMKANAALLSRIEQRFGVPAAGGDRALGSRKRLRRL